MPRWTFLSLAAVLAAISVVGAQVFRSGGSDTVTLPVFVLTKSGQPVSGLTSADFEVLENGQPQRILTFAEGASGARVPLHLGLMLDRSESMELDMRTAADAAVRFVSALDEAEAADDVTFVEFATGIQVGRYAPTNYPQLFERIRGGRLGERTALYDAIDRYVETTLDQSGQHVLLVYTDGGDSSSHTTIDDLRNVLRLGRAMVYFVGYIDNQSITERDRQRSLMQQLSHETGGEAFFPTSARELTHVYGQIRAELAGRYTLGYASSDAQQDGRFRKVEVRLTQTPTPGTHVRTRSGYLALRPAASR